MLTLRRLRQKIRSPEVAYGTRDPVSQNKANKQKQKKFTRKTNRNEELQGDWCKLTAITLREAGQHREFQRRYNVNLCLQTTAIKTNRQTYR